jgi:hypothetical protein
MVQRRRPVSRGYNHLLITAVVVLVACLSLDCAHPSPRLASVSLSARPRFSLVAFFLTDIGCERVPILYRFLRKCDWPNGFSYYFVNYSLRNLTSPPSLAPSEHYRRLIDIACVGGQWGPITKSSELYAKFFFALDFFLSTTSARWMWRGTDDVVINVPRLASLISVMEERSNPLREFVAKGNCMTGTSYGQEIPFLQGGAGYLLSRFACQQLLPWAKYVQLTGMKEEDAHFGDFLRTEMHVSGPNMTSSAFVGYTIKPSDQRALIKKNFTAMSVCGDPNEGSPGWEGCGKFRAPLRNVVFFHQHLQFSKYSIKLAKAVFRAPDWVWWWMTDYEPNLCRHKRFEVDGL